MDNALSYSVAELLSANAHDAIHVLDIGLGAASDEIIFEYARLENRVIISADTDFGALLAQQRTPRPSVVLFRWPGLRRADDQARVLLANLPNVFDALTEGAVVVIESHRVRVRTLPMSP